MRSLVTAALLLTAAWAQQPAPGPAANPPPRTAPRELVLQNVAPFARREGVAIAVPFAAGTVRDLPDLHVEGTATAWQPFGARWPDGSLRFALCLFVAELGGLRERSLPLVAGRGPELPGDAMAPLSCEIDCVVRLADRTVRATLQRVEDCERNPLRTVERRRARIGDTGLVAEVLLTCWRDQPHAGADVAVFFSDPRLPAMQLPIEELAFEARGRVLLLHHAAQLGVRQTTTQDGSRCVLLARRTLGDGQGLRRSGALLPPLRGDGSLADQTSQAAAVAPLLGATDWRASGAFGPFGLVPELPPWLAGDGLRRHLAARHRAFVDRAPADADPLAPGPLGLARNAGQTGDQYDFGVVKLSVVAHSGLPSLLFEASASVLQEACRPVHFFAADGAPVDPAAHPDWIVWSGRTHWHAGVSPDRLGKPAPEPPFEANGWTGKDREHWSSNTLGAFALLTGSHWARDELANEARLYLAGQTVDPQKSTSGAGAPRGAGRTALAAAWMYLATGDERLRERIVQRTQQVYHAQWPGRTLGPDRVRTMQIHDPDPRMLGGSTRYWTPWQDAIAAVGFAATFAVTGEPRARELAEQLALTVVRHGWRLDGKECIVATALRWQDGEPLAPSSYDDPKAALWSHGTAFSEWALPACEIARTAALAAGDAATAARAAEIQRRVRATRRRPPDGPPEHGGIDRLTEWDAVRWPPSAE